MPLSEGSLARDAHLANNSESAINTARIPVIDASRGLASISVAWFHLTRVGFRFAPLSGLELSGRYGWLGVEVFFVISGFVIPWSLYCSGYTGRSFLRFVARRVVRLDPPYLASVCLVLALALAGPLLPPASTVGPVAPADVALHLGYANLVAGRRWLNPVYWTLAIEMQWYLLSGVIYGPIAAAKPRLRWLAMAALSAAPFIPDLPYAPRRGLLFPFLGFFVMGVAAFHRRVGTISRAEMLVMVGAGAAVSTLRVGFVAAVAAMATALVIAEVDARLRRLQWLGEISYSLYLVHVPIATPFIRYAIAHHVGPIGRCALLFLALAVCLTVATGFAALVELPARRLAARIEFRRRSLARAPSSSGRLTPAVAFEAQP